jgi:hypothetical protein
MNPNLTRIFGFAGIFFAGGQKQGAMWQGIPGHVLVFNEYCSYLISKSILI